MFSVHTKAGVFNFLLFELSVIEKLRFSWRISVDGTPNQRNKAAFSKLSSEVWTQNDSYFD